MKSEAALALAKAIDDGLNSSDNGQFDLPGERNRIAERLTREGVRPEVARAYAEAFVEYTTMAKAIETDGPKPAHTRRRDRARDELTRLRWVEADWLWNG